MREQDVPQSDLFTTTTIISRAELEQLLAIFGLKMIDGASSVMVRLERPIGACESNLVTEGIEPLPQPSLTITEQVNVEPR